MSRGVNRNCYIKASKTDSTSKRKRRSTPRQCSPRTQPFQLTDTDMDELVGIVDGNIELDQRIHTPSTNTKVKAHHDQQRQHQIR